MMYQILDGFFKIMLLFAVFIAFFAVLFGVTYAFTHFGWFNIIWVIPFFLLVCYVCGEDYRF